MPTLVKSSSNRIPPESNGSQMWPNRGPARLKSIPSGVRRGRVGPKWGPMNLFRPNHHLGGLQPRVSADLFRDSKPKPNSSALGPPATEKVMFFREKAFFGMSRKKVGISPRECVFRNQRPRFSPLWGTDQSSYRKRIDFR